jgi:hypothetical protein
LLSVLKTKQVMIIAPVAALAGHKRDCSSQQQEEDEALVATGRREKKQRVAMAATAEQSAKAQQQLNKKLLQRRLVQEAMKEIQPIALGSLAMVASTLCNQGAWGGGM